MNHKYKQTELGLIPSDWEVKRLGDIGFFKKGKGIRKDEVFPDGLPCIRYGELYTRHNEYVKKINSFISQNVAKESQRIAKGDILFAGSGETREEIGKCAAFLSDKETYAGGDIVILSPKNCDSLFLGFLLNDSIIAKQKAQNGQGDAVVHIYPNGLSRILLPIPPTLAEQTAIATALSDADGLITSLEKLIAKKRNIKQGAMQELLRPKEGWVVKTYGDVFDFLTTATYSRADLTAIHEIGYVHYGDIHTKWNSFLDFEKFKLPTISKFQLKNYPLLKEGDIVMADASEDYAGVGESVEVKNLGHKKAIAGLHTFLLRDKKGVFVDGFRGYIHKNKIVKNQIETLASGLKVYGISKYNLKTVSIPIPSPTEQARIATILSDMDTEISILEKKLEKAKRVKQGMMQQLLTGKIRLI